MADVYQDLYGPGGLQGAANASANAGDVERSMDLERSAREGGDLLAEIGVHSDPAIQRHATPRLWAPDGSAHGVAYNMRDSRRGVVEVAEGGGDAGRNEDFLLHEFSHHGMRNAQPSTRRSVRLSIERAWGATGLGQEDSEHLAIYTAQLANSRSGASARNALDFLSGILGRQVTYNEARGAWDSFQVLNRIRGEAEQAARRERISQRASSSLSAISRAPGRAAEE